MLLLLACTQQLDPIAKPDEDSGLTDDSGDTDTDTAPVDTADTDGDLDDDGFTPDEGDCDDQDIHVAPGREEDDDDGVDNDCDGRVDEDFAGVTVAYTDDAGGESELLVLDTIGRVDEALGLGSCYPTYIDRHGDGWVVSNGGAAVAVVDADGNCTDVGDFSDTEVYEYGVWGVATVIDGTIYAVTLASLVSVGLDGTITEVATWGFDLEDPANHELAVASIAVDPATGDLGLFDYFGGFATWSADAGLVIEKLGDYETATMYTTSGAHRDAGGWYVLASDMNVYAWGATDWELAQPWTNGDWVPSMLTIDGDTGAFYLSSNGAWTPTVWRLDADSGELADLYTTEAVDDRSFTGIVANYTYGG
jgi:hypothetical protein